MIINTLRWEIRQSYRRLENEVASGRKKKRGWDPSLDYPHEAPNMYHDGGPLYKWSLGFELSASDVRWLKDQGYLPG